VLAFKIWGSKYGQERNQLSEDDPELPDLGRRRVYAAVVRLPGALCLEDPLAVGTYRAYQGTREGQEFQTLRKTQFVTALRDPATKKELSS